MSRFYSPIPKDEFMSKIFDIFKTYEEESFNQTITKDLSKVMFDMENMAPHIDFEDETKFNEEGFGGYPCGYKELEDGFHVFFVNAGGDSEHPICFILYWDGKKMRAYIPKEGNAWNKQYKTAYGAEMENGMDDEEIEALYDSEEHRKKVEAEISEEKLIEDIKNRIKRK